MLIVFEGIDGSGKTSVLTEIDMLLRQKGNCVVRFKEPSTGPYGQLFRRVSRNLAPPNFANSLLIKDRIWDVRNNILPALKSGKIVLLDRYYYSHIFQANNISDAMRLINFNRKIFPLPDLTLIFDVSPLTARRRIFESRDRMEALERRLTQARVMYRQLITYPDVTRINATPALDKVTKRAIVLIQNSINKRKNREG